MGAVFLSLVFLCAVLYRAIRRTLGKIKIKPRVYGILVATVFLFVAVFWGEEFEYWFFNLLKFVVFCACAYSAYECERKIERLAFACVALLYNPFLPVNLGEREPWIVINIVSVVFFVASVAFSFCNKNGRTTPPTS